MTDINRFRGLRGQSTVEFVIIFPLLLTVLFAIGSFAFLSYQNTVVQNSLSTLADELPAGWEQEDTNKLVADLIVEGTDLSKENLSVSNASVKVLSDTTLEDGSDIARDLGASTLRTETKRVRVSADIAYRYVDPLSLHGETVFKRHVSRTYTSYTDWEVL